MGVQVVGRRGDDARMLRLAEAYHQATDSGRGAGRPRSDGPRAPAAFDGRPRSGRSRTGRVDAIVSLRGAVRYVDPKGGKRSFVPTLPRRGRRPRAAIQALPGLKANSWSPSARRRQAAPYISRSAALETGSVQVEEPTKMSECAFDLCERERQGVQAFDLCAGATRTGQDPPDLPPRIRYGTCRAFKSGLFPSATERRRKVVELRFELPMNRVERGRQLVQKFGSGYPTHRPVENNDRVPEALDSVCYLMHIHWLEPGRRHPGVASVQMFKKAGVQGASRRSIFLRSGLP